MDQNTFHCYLEENHPIQHASETPNRLKTIHHQTNWKIQKFCQSFPQVIFISFALEHVHCRPRLFVTNITGKNYPSMLTPPIIDFICLRPPPQWPHTSSQSSPSIFQVVITCTFNNYHWETILFWGRPWPIFRARLFVYQRVYFHPSPCSTVSAK